MIPSNNPARVELAALGSPALFDLLATQQATVDRLMVGPWMGETWLTRCRDYLPQPPLLHCATSLIDRAFSPPSLLSHIQRLQPPWVSLHLDVPAGWLYRWWLRLGIPLPLITRARALRWAVEHLKQLQAVVERPIAVENQAHHRPNGHAYLTTPDFIRHVLDETGGYLLLDVGHARVSAAMRGQPVEDYLAALPLTRVIEIHAHAPGLHRGRLRDLHQPLGQADYDLLVFLLARCPQVRAVTLEYDGNAALLGEQLARLRTLLTVCR